MKILFTILLVMSSMLILVGCGSGSNDSPLIGTWELVVIITNGYRWTAGVDDSSQTMALYSDGAVWRSTGPLPNCPSYTTCSPGTPWQQVGTWSTTEGELTIDWIYGYSDKYTYTIEGGVLTLVEVEYFFEGDGPNYEDAGRTQIFKRI